MAILYCNKSGNDANDGSTTVLAKLTVQAAATAAASGDTIVVGSGLYNEKVAYTNKTLTFYADGTVVMDATGIAGTAPLLQGSCDGNYVMTVAPYNTNAGRWIFQNNAGATYMIYLVSAANSTTTVNIILTNCTLIASSNTNGAYVKGAYYSRMTATGCVFTGFTTGSGLYVWNRAYVNNLTVVNCTFCNCSCGARSFGETTATGTISITYSIFYNCTYAWSLELTTTMISNDNLYYGVSNWSIELTQAPTYTTYSSFAQVQAAGYDSRSVVADPLFTDATNNIFYLKSAASIANVGAYPYFFTQGSANDSLGKWNIAVSADNSGWYNPDGNITKNGTTGNLEQTAGTEGVIWSPVYDLGASYVISQINLEALQIWPSSMVDYDKTDVRPNYQTIEYRVNRSSFNQDDGVIAWTVVKSNFPFTRVVGRFIQLRFTLRNDDVAG